MPITIDRSSEFGARVLRRLDEEHIIWLTTVGADGTPQPNPVWFLWAGDRLLIYSQPDHKVGNIERSDHVSLNFHATDQGSDVVVLTGQATLGQVTEIPAESAAAYMAKYAQGIKGLGMDPESFAATYGRLITIDPSKVRGF